MNTFRLSDSKPKIPRNVPASLIFVGDRRERAEAVLNDVVEIATSLFPERVLRRIARRWAAVLDAELKAVRR